MKLKAELIIGTGFLKDQSIVIDFPRQRLVAKGDRVISFSNTSNYPKLSLLRAKVFNVVFPGDIMTFPIEILR